MTSNEPAKPKPTISCEQCGKATGLQPRAEGKRFCSNDCRNKWHSARRKQALEALAKQEKK